jgi:hypothetical protein
MLFFMSRAPFRTRHGKKRFLGFPKGGYHFQRVGFQFENNLPKDRKKGEKNRLRDDRPVIWDFFTGFGFFL